MGHAASVLYGWSRCVVGGKRYVLTLEGSERG